MKYEAPKFILMRGPFEASAACCGGTNPQGYNACGAGGDVNRGGCNSGCGAANHCHVGTDAGQTGQTNQCCENGASAEIVSQCKCALGAGYGYDGGGCNVGNQAAGCMTGNSPTYGPCVAGTTG